MPSLAPLLAHRRILRATDRSARHVAGDADVASDALADIVEASLLDLPWQERIGDARPRRADHVEHAASDLIDHCVRRGEAAHTDDRLAGVLLDPVREGLLCSLLGETRGDRVVVPRGHVHVPEVRKVREHVHDLLRFCHGHALVAEQFLHREAHDHAAGVTDRFLGVLDDLAEEPHAILERSPILVGSMIPPPLQEVHRQAEVVPRVDVDEVEARRPSANGGLAVPATVLADVVFRHRPRLVWVAVLERLVRWRERDLTRVEIRRRRSVVSQFQCRERSVPMHALAHQRERWDIGVIPEARLHVRREVAARMDLALLGGDDGPAAFGLRLAHRCVRRGHLVPHAVAVRDLEEAVARGDGPDPHRFEKDVVAGVAGHDVPKVRRAPSAPLPTPRFRPRADCRTFREP